MAKTKLTSEQKPTKTERSHQSGFVITRTYHGSNTNLWATWQPGSSTLGGTIQVMLSLSCGDGEMSMLAVKKQNYAASENGFEQPEMQHTVLWNFINQRYRICHLMLILAKNDWASTTE